MDLEEAICGLVRYIYEEDDDYALKVVYPANVRCNFGTGTKFTNS